MCRAARSSPARPLLSWAVMRSVRLSLSSAVCLLLACGGSPDGSEVSRKLGSDLFSFGPDVQLREPTDGSVVAAGEHVSIAASVLGDTLVSGGQLDLRGPFAADLYALGGQVTLDGPVAGSVRAAAGSVQLRPSSSVVGGISIATGEAEIEGALHDYLQVAAGTTRLNASVDGDVEVTGGTLEVGPSAAIGGSLTFRGSTPPVISPEARIAGEVRHIAPPTPSAWADWAFDVFWALGLATIGALAFALLPGTSRALSEVATRNARSALLVGVSILLGVPVAAFFSLVSIIGAPLGLFALYLYVLCLPVGYLISSVALADQLQQRWRPAAETRTGARLLMLVLVLVSLGGLSGIPILGWLLRAALSAIGIGSAAIYGWRRFHERHPHRPSGAARPPLPSDAVPQTG